jgi:predicted DNA-binding protein
VAQMQDKHKYRVQIYLGKEMYERLESISKFMGIPVATVAKLILNTGFELSNVLENQMKKGLENGIK